MAFASFCLSPHFQFAKGFDAARGRIGLPTTCTSVLTYGEENCFLDNCWRWLWIAKSGTNVPVGCIYHIPFSLSALGTDTRHCLVVFSREQTVTELMPWLHSLQTHGNRQHPREAQIVKQRQQQSLRPNSCVGFVVLESALGGWHEMPTLSDTLSYLGVRC